MKTFLKNLGLSSRPTEDSGQASGHKVSYQRSNANKGFSLVELLVVVGIIGILSAVGLPLYKAQQDSATEAVIKSNAFSVQRLVDNHLALVDPVTTAKLAGQLKVKGKPLKAACFTIDSGTTEPSIVTSGEAWAVSMKNITGCALEKVYNGCIDSTGVITRVTTITTSACTPDATVHKNRDLNL